MSIATAQRAYDRATPDYGDDDIDLDFVAAERSINLDDVLVDLIDAETPFMNAIRSSDAKILGKMILAMYRAKIERRALAEAGYYVRPELSAIHVAARVYMDETMTAHRVKA